MNASEAALLSGINHGTVLRHLADGVLCGEQQRTGSQWYISSAEFFSWVAWCTTQGYVMYPMENVKRRYADLLSKKI